MASPSSSSSSTYPVIGKRPSILPVEPVQRPKKAPNFLSGASKPEHSEKGIIPISDLDAHFDSLLLPGEWLKTDYKHVRVPPAMTTAIATEFLDDLNSLHRIPFDDTMIK